MTKKIGMWVLYTGIVGLLIFGGVNRTLAMSGQDESQNAGRIDEAGSNQSRSGEGKDDSHTAGVGDGEHEANIKAGDWIELSGTITEFDASSLWIQINAGDVLEVEGRAWRFIQESGYLAVVGKEIDLTGFYENEEFEISQIRDLTTGVNVFLRDDTGRPLWSGGGRN